MPICPGRKLQNEEGLEQLSRHAGQDIKAPAQLHRRLAVSGLESDVQHLGRMGRLPGPVPLGERGHHVHRGRRQIQR